MSGPADGGPAPAASGPVRDGTTSDALPAPGPDPVAPSLAPGLRAMRWWDASAVAAAERVLFGPDAWSEETVWGELASPGRWYVVAQDPAGEVLGYAGLAGPHGPGGDADVATVAVLPGAQGRGTGRTLLRALLARAADRRAAAVLLEVRTGNDAARALYASEGFERLAVRARYYADGSDAEVMRWRPRRGATLGR